jgi:hypothetical protein
MPLKNKIDTPTWREWSTPQTPLERGNFIDACTSWLVHEPDDEEEESQILETTSVDVVKNVNRQQLVYTHLEINAGFKRICSLCENPSSHLILANPYSQRCYIVLCASHYKHAKHN